MICYPKHTSIFKKISYLYIQLRDTSQLLHVFVSKLNHLIHRNYLRVNPSQSQQSPIQFYLDFDWVVLLQNRKLGNKCKRCQNKKKSLTMLDLESCGLVLVFIFLFKNLISRETMVLALMLFFKRMNMFIMKN